MSLRLIAATGLGAAVVRADDKEFTAEMKKLAGSWEPTEKIWDFDHFVEDDRLALS